MPLAGWRSRPTTRWGSESLRTTTLGAYPKPDYVPVSDWFRSKGGDYTSSYETELAGAGGGAEELFVRATAEVIADQIDAGIDVVTDGEVRRENYIHYQCRHISGFDFSHLSEKRMRGTTTALLPTIRSRIGSGPSPLADDYLVAQSVSSRPVKVTVPGPMTIIDSTVDDYYHDDVALGADLARVVNDQVLEVVAAGCKHIQIDEPVMARNPDIALAHGIDQLSACFDDVPGDVSRVVHACCGYPNALDQEDYPKADIGAYLELAAALDQAPIDEVSLEDAHRYNDLPELLARFETTTIVLGVVAVARSRIESVEEISERLRVALGHIPATRLVAAPDCGLGYLTRELAVAKLTNLCEAASALP